MTGTTDKYLARAQDVAVVGLLCGLHFPPMRLPATHAFKFLPLVFLIGIEGFAMFAPYIVAMLTFAYVVRRLKADGADEPQPEPVTVSA